MTLFMNNPITVLWCNDGLEARVCVVFILVCRETQTNNVAARACEVYNVGLYNLSNYNYLQKYKQVTSKVSMYYTEFLILLNIYGAL